MLEECEYFEHQFVDREIIDRTHPTTIRLFHTNSKIDEYHASVFEKKSAYETHIVDDQYAEYKTKDQLASAGRKIYKMKLDETVGLPYKKKLLIDKL